MIDPHKTLSEVQDLTGMTDNTYLFLIFRGVRTFEEFMKYNPHRDIDLILMDVLREVKGLQRDWRGQWDRAE